MPPFERLASGGYCLGAQRVDLLQRGPHKHVAGSGLIRPPHAAVEAERVDDPEDWIPDFATGEWSARERAGPTDLHPDIVIGHESERLRRLSPGSASGGGALGCSKPRCSMAITASGFAHQLGAVIQPIAARANTWGSIDYGSTLEYQSRQYSRKITWLMAIAQS